MNDQDESEQRVREECARIVENAPDRRKRGPEVWRIDSVFADELAAAIRAGGKR